MLHGFGCYLRVLCKVDHRFSISKLNSVYVVRCMGQLVNIENCREKSLIVKNCVNSYLVFFSSFFFIKLLQMCCVLVSCVDFEAILTPFRERLFLIVAVLSFYTKDDGHYYYLSLSAVCISVLQSHKMSFLFVIFIIFLILFLLSAVHIHVLQSPAVWTIVLTQT